MGRRAIELRNLLIAQALVCVPILTIFVKDAALTDDARKAYEDSVARWTEATREARASAEQGLCNRIVLNVYAIAEALLSVPVLTVDPQQVEGHLDDDLMKYAIRIRCWLATTNDARRDAAEILGRVPPVRVTEDLREIAAELLEPAAWRNLRYLETCRRIGETPTHPHSDAYDRAVLWGAKTSDDFKTWSIDIDDSPNGIAIRSSLRSAQIILMMIAEIGQDTARIDSLKDQDL